MHASHFLNGREFQVTIKRNEQPLKPSYRNVPGGQDKITRFALKITTRERESERKRRLIHVNKIASETIRDRKSYRFPERLQLARSRARVASESNSKFRRKERTKERISLEREYFSRVTLRVSRGGRKESGVFGGGSVVIPFSREPLQRGLPHESAPKSISSPDDFHRRGTASRADE